MHRQNRVRSVCILTLAALLLSQPANAQRRRSARNLRNSPSVKAAFREAVRKSRASTVRVLVDDKAVALGCVVTEQGHVLTKASLVSEGAVTLQLPDGEVVDASRGQSDQQFDVLLLKADSAELPPMQFTSVPPDVGRFVAAADQDGSILGVGLISWEVNRSGLRTEPPIQPNAFMGIQVRPAQGGGLRIAADVDKESPAGKAGLTKDDVLLSIAGFQVNAQLELLRVLAKQKPGQEVPMRITRDGKEKTGSITLGTRGPRDRRSTIDQWGGGTGANFRSFSQRRYAFPRVITHDISIRPDDCGGPLVTTKGEVIGVNIARALRVATYAIPADAIRPLVDRLTEKKPASRTVTRTSTPAKKANSPRDKHGRLVRSEPIRANGITGSLLLYSAEIPPDAFSRFMDLAKQSQASVVVIAGNDREAAPPGLRSAWHEQEGTAFHRVVVAEESHANDTARLEVLAQATGVWIGRELTLEALQGTELAKAIQALQERGGIVSGPARLLAEHSTSQPDAGAGLLPDSVVTDRTAKSKIRELRRKNPFLIEYTIENEAALLVRGRYMFAVGGAVTAAFSDSDAWPDQDVRMEGRQLADLTALRRVATRRTGPLFPPEKPEAPVVESGTLMIVGGGGLPKGLIDEFVEEAGGDEAVICVIPISMPASQLPRRDRMAEYFRKLGAKEVHVLRQRTPEESDSQEVLDILKRTTGIWFGGGRQWRFIDAYEDTQAAQLMHDVLKRGGVIGGSSAGASIQGDYMARGNPLGPRNIMADGYETGLRFLKGVAIDQHFTQRNRLPDLASLVDRYPQLLGIGIDETTAIVVRKNIAEVMGKHRVCFYDRGKPVLEDGPDFEAVRAGGRYDLVARKVLDPGQPAEPEKDTDSRQ